MKGCQKKIILLKGTGSTLFEEAYFILRENRECVRSEEDIISEARRIAEGEAAVARTAEKCRTRFVVLSALCGALAALLFSLTVLLLYGCV